MPYYKVKKVYKSIEEVEVFAKDICDATSKALQEDGVQTDYYLYDTEVREVEGEE